METTVRGPSDGSPVRATPVVGTADLRRAIDDDELFLLFQPLIDLHADRVAGVEALQLRGDVKGKGHAVVGGLNLLLGDRFRAQFQAERALRPGDEAAALEYSLQLATRF